MFKQMNSHWDDVLLTALKLPEDVDLWYAELPQVWKQVEGSYSGDKIGMEGRVRRPFEHRWGGHRVGAYPHGGHYVATGGILNRYADYYTCYLLTPRPQFEGDVGTYCEWDWPAKRESELGAYHGMLVHWKKEPYILTGPPLIWWRKGKQFRELAEILQAPAVQKIASKLQPSFTMKPTQLILL